MRNQCDYKSNVYHGSTVQGDLLYATLHFSDNRIKGAQKSVDAVKNTGEEQEVEPEMDRLLINEKKGNVLAGKSRILAGTEIHNKTSDNEQAGNRKSYNYA